MNESGKALVAKFYDALAKGKEAIDREIAGAMPAFEQQFQSGAGRFVQGDGRHGRFD